MSWSLSDYQARVREVLVDAGVPQGWDTATLTAAVRAALGELNLADGESAFTISELDGAGASTVPAKFEPVLGLGAAGYAAISRGLDEAEKLRVNGEAGKLLSEWGGARLREFRAMLATVYPTYALMAGAGLGGGPAGADPARTAAEVGLLQVQAAKVQAEAAAIAAEEARAGQAGQELASAAKAQAEAELAISQAAHLDGEEDRARAAAAQAAQDRADEAARLAGLRGSTVTPWGQWLDEEGIHYPDDYERR